MTEHNVEKVQEPGLLLAAELNGRDFLVDVENRQFRNFKYPDEVIGMHSQQGRRMVRDVQGSEWKSYGVSSGGTGKAQVEA